MESSLKRVGSDPHMLLQSTTPSKRNRFDETTTMTAAAASTVMEIDDDPIPPEVLKQYIEDLENLEWYGEHYINPEWPLDYQESIIKHRRKRRAREEAKIRERLNEAQKKYNDLKSKGLVKGYEFAERRPLDPYVRIRITHDKDGRGIINPAICEERFSLDEKTDMLYAEFYVKVKSSGRIKMSCSFNDNYSAALTLDHPYTSYPQSARIDIRHAVHDFLCVMKSEETPKQCKKLCDELLSNLKDHSLVNFFEYLRKEHENLEKKYPLVKNLLEAPYARFSECESDDEVKEKMEALITKTCEEEMKNANIIKSMEIKGEYLQYKLEIAAELGLVKELPWTKSNESRL